MFVCKSGDVLNEYTDLIKFKYPDYEQIQKWQIPVTKIASKDWKLLFEFMLNNGSPTGYASGLELEQYNGYRVISHTGYWPGFRTRMLVIPQLDYAVTFFTNCSDDIIPTAPPSTSRKPIRRNCLKTGLRSLLLQLSLRNLKNRSASNLQPGRSGPH